jgi:hypothetical protein
VTEGRSELAAMLRAFGQGVVAVGSPLYGELLTAAAGDCERGGLVWDVLKDVHAEGPGSAFPLRLMGALHRLALEGKAPELEPYFKPDGADPADAWPAALHAMRQHIDEVRRIVGRGVQTNEVGRSAVLAPGFVLIGAETGMPLRLLEVGSSGGLNLRWDRYRYEGKSWRYGPEESALRFTEMFQDAEPPSAGHVVVAERAGCDPAPLDPTTEDGRLTLMSYVWPDQPGRLDRLRNALDIAFELPVHIQKAHVMEWLPQRLHGDRGGTTTVVFHSVVMQYIAERDDYVAFLHQAGARATRDAPLAWLRFEPVDLETGSGPFELRLTTWPGGHEHLLAESHPHGPPVRWLG